MAEIEFPYVTDTVLNIDPNAGLPIWYVHIPDSAVETLNFTQNYWEGGNFSFKSSAPELTLNVIAYGYQLVLYFEGNVEGRLTLDPGGNGFMPPSQFSFNCNLTTAAVDYILATLVAHLADVNFGGTMNLAYSGNAQPSNPAGEADLLTLQTDGRFTVLLPPTE